MTRSYDEVRVRLTVSGAETAEAVLLGMGAWGTAQETPASAEPAARPEGAPRREGDLVEVRAYFAGGGAPSVEAVAEALERLGGPEGPARPAGIVVSTHPWQDWVAQSRIALGPFMATPRLRIVPPWERPDPPDQGQRRAAAHAGASGAPRPAVADELIIDPGQAFGIGTHATTRACLALLEELPGSARRGPALDVGTGTGILALRAARLGFAPVTACDHDPLAAEAARGNARCNGLSSLVAIFAGEVAALRDGPRYSLILANIFLNPLRELAPFFARRLEPGAALIVSGFHEEDRSGILESLGRHGLALDREQALEGWLACALRPAARAPRSAPRAGGRAGGRQDPP
ncbi:MAG: 50S ribosomal protein L11 methyltransferase [Candidatus Eisenbacteria bacterium]|uniref:50S ribosomal protein L11 methyltransferase n=1 Tax=Eiseniibacteriota bacterium TaxID=2212470 RepID=A0A938BPY3_UNCEI|nr:50S ribosomal protein L11 methyltransferase [Candidatus Eisenbacteria bacterium]